MDFTTINFFSEEIAFQPKNAERIKDGLHILAKDHQYQINDLNYIFCTDEYLHKINLEYLQHDTYTDIITFDNSEEANTIEGDIFISIERVKENAHKFQADFQKELIRVISHGLFHLLGFGDKTDEEASTMRKKENEAIKFITSLF